MARRFRPIPRANVRDLRREGAPSVEPASAEEPTSDDAPEAPEGVGEVSYRDLQAQAKDAGVSASGTRQELERRIAEAKL